MVGIVPLGTLERFGPFLLGISLTLLGAGILVSSFAIAGPIRSRLSDLRRTAQQIERGDLSARAKADGSDEVAEVARALNAMADELWRRTTALETSDRLRRQLVTDVSHELMTPLTAVLGHLETLEMPEVQLNEEQRRRQIAVAAKEALRLKRLIG